MESITKINTLTNNNLPINYDDDILLNTTLNNMELSETSYNQYIVKNQSFKNNE